MESIEHAGITLSEQDWLEKEGVVDTWHVYYRAWSAGDNTGYEEYPGSDFSLGEVVRIVSDELRSIPSNEMPVVDISAEPIEQFYPEVPVNTPQEIVFYDGGAWYWTCNCERGDYLPDYISY